MAGLRETVIPQVRQRLDSAESRQRELLHCGSAAADPGWLERLITRRVSLGRWSEALERRPDDIKNVIEFATE